MGGEVHITPPCPTWSETSGTKPMSIAGRTISERERLTGMTPEERAWRKKWLKDQVLTPREPIEIPIRNAEFMNPIRRFYRWPLDTLFFKVLQPSIGEVPAQVFRFYIGRSLLGLAGIFLGFYYFKYNTATWESKSGWRIIASRKAVYPGEPGWPKVGTKTRPEEYTDRGFLDSVLGHKITKELGHSKQPPLVPRADWP